MWLQLEKEQDLRLCDGQAWPQRMFLSFHLVFSLSLPLTLLIVPSSLSKEWTWPGVGEGEATQKETSTGLSQIDLMDEETGLGDSAWPRLTSHWWLVQV